MFRSLRIFCLCYHYCTVFLFALNIYHIIYQYNQTQDVHMLSLNIFMTYLIFFSAATTFSLDSFLVANKEVVFVVG